MPADQAPRTAPCGSWKSSTTSQDIVQGLGFETADRIEPFLIENLRGQS